MSQKLSVILGAALILLAGCTTPSSAPTADAALPSLSYAGSKQPLVALDAEIAAAGLDSAKLAPIATRLLGLLRDPGTTFAARQAICERLREFPVAVLTTEEALRTFRAMLTSEHEIELARLAIERVPGQALDALFLDALQSATPSTRLALIQSAGNRHLAGAVPILSVALSDADPQVATSAAKALSLIGASDSADHAAFDALQHSPHATAPAVVEAELVIVHAWPADTAAPQLEAISQTAEAPASLRAAAYHGLLTAQPEAAPARIVHVLTGNDPILKPVVIEAIAAHPSRELARVLAEQLPTFDSTTRAAVIAALGRRGDPAATHAIASATRETDPAVRAAAITALGLLSGTPETATLLATLTTSGDRTEAKLARQSLARLNGSDVADTILAGIRAGAPALRIAFIESLATREMTDAVPLLLSLRQDDNSRIRAAALGSLADLATGAEQPAILDWALAATDPSEQSRALRALAAVALRQPDRTAGTQPIVDALDRAPAATAARLVPVLARLGGAPAAACATRLANRGDPALANAAIATLARWSDATGVPALVDIAAHASTDSVGADAVDAALHYLDQDRKLPSADLSATIARLLPSATEPATRSRLVYLLGRCSDDAALALATQLKTDAGVAADAAAAVLAINANRAGVPVVAVSSSEYQVKNLLDGNPQTRWSVPATAGQWIQIDFHTPRPVRRLVLDQGKWPDEYPDHLEVFLTDDPTNPGSPRASAAGQSNRTTLNLAAGTPGRYLLIRHTTERAESTWTIAELLID